MSVLSDDLRIANLEREVRELRDQVEALRWKTETLKPGGSPNQEPSAPASQDPCIREVVLATQDLFVGPVTIEVEYDPEDRADGIVVFSVKYPGEAKDIVQKHCDWNDRISQLQPGSSGKLRLIVYPE